MLGGRSGAQTHTAWSAPGRTPPCFPSKELDIKGFVGCNAERVRKRLLLFPAFIIVSGLHRAGRMREPEVRALSGYSSRCDFLWWTDLGAATIRVRQM